MFRLQVPVIFLVVLITAFFIACKRHSSSGYSSSSGPSYSSSPSSGDLPSTSGNNNTSTPGPANSQAPVPAPANLTFIRPALAVYRGQYFTYTMPTDWQVVAETGNGIDMKSPDDRMGASATLLTGAVGSTTPWVFTYNALAGAGCRDINGLSRIDWPSRESAYPGIYWEIQEFDLTYTDQKGLQRHADFIAAICNAYGGYSALLQGFATTADVFDQAKTWLPIVASNVNANDPNSIAYQHQLIPVQNHPLDNTGLMESWREKRLSEDRIAKAQREGMMGYERLVSPSTGRFYNMPLETYDGGYGGYHNPDHPEEILNRTDPGN